MFKIFSYFSHTCLTIQENKNRIYLLQKEYRTKEYVMIKRESNIIFKHNQTKTEKSTFLLPVKKGHTYISPWARERWMPPLKSLPVEVITIRDYSHTDTCFSQQKKFIFVILFKILDLFSVRTFTMKDTWVKLCGVILLNVTQGQRFTVKIVGTLVMNARSRDWELFKYVRVRHWSLHTTWA